MKCPFVGWVFVVCCLCAVRADAANATFPLKKPDLKQPVTIPWEDLNERATALAKHMMERPTVQAHGPVVIALQLVGGAGGHGVGDPFVAVLGLG